MKSMSRPFKVYLCCIFLIAVVFYTHHALGGEFTGDVNNDGSVDLVDAILTSQILTEQVPAGMEINIGADVNGDNQIGAQETIFCLQWAAGLRGNPQSDNADLSALTFCCGVLTPAFDPGIFSYIVAVENSVSEVTVTATAADANASITVAGNDAVSGEASDPVHVDVGYGPIDIVVTAEDGTTSRTYTINVFRQEADPQSNDYLSGIALSDGTLVPAFHPDTLLYTSQVPTDTDQITVTATTQESGAHIMINGTIVTSGTPSAPISLVEGEANLITILVMAPDNVTTRMYEIRVSRGEVQELGTNAFLSGLTISNALLNEPFFPVLFNYSAMVANDVFSIVVTPETEDPNATVTVNGAPVVSGQPSPDIDLSVGENAILVEVTAQDQRVTRTYTIDVTREEAGASGNAALSGLILSNTSLNPSFSPGVFSYTANVLNYVEQIVVSPTAADPAAIIRVNGTVVNSGQASSPINLLIGDNPITITVTAENGTMEQAYSLTVSRHGAPAGVAATVYVVDAPATSDNQFVTLPAALAHLSDTLTLDQLGEVRIQTTQPMTVDELNFACNVVITQDPGASTTIIGPGTSALVIHAGGSLDISGLNFVNASGFVINSSAGFAATGSQFGGDTAINVGSGTSSLSGRSALALKVAAGSGFVSRDLSFDAGNISGGLNVTVAGATQKDISVANTTAASMGVSGAFTESSYLRLKANLIPELTINVDLRNESKLDVAGHANLAFAGTDITMEGGASATFNSNTIAKLETEIKGVKGLVSFENTFVGNAAIQLNALDADFRGNNLNANEFKMELSNQLANGRWGVNLDGGFVDQRFSFSAPDLSLEASLTLAITGCKSNGPADISLSGQAEVTFDNFIVGAEAMIKYGLGSGKLTMNNTEFYAKAFVQSLDRSIEVNAGVSNLKLHDDMNWNFASTNFIIRFGDSGESGAEVDEGHNISIRGGYGGVNGLDAASHAPLAEGGGEIWINHVNIKGSAGKPALFIEDVDVPVTIENSQIKSGQWAIVCRDVDGIVTIRDNMEIEGGIFLDGDPEQTGKMIDKQYTVSGNPISHSYPGMSCIQTHAIHDVLIEDTDMTATGGGAHGVHVSGGKVIIRRGSIVTPGPELSQAIGVGESAGGHNGIVYAEEVSVITGAVQTGPKGYISLVDNTFSNAKVIDYKEGLVAYPRLLNDPVANNEGLDPDEDIIGSLTDWNDDEHNCPDYPTKCDQWDDDAKECGCGEDGVDPPVDPGV